MNINNESLQKSASDAKIFSKKYTISLLCCVSSMKSLVPNAVDGARRFFNLLSNRESEEKKFEQKIDV